MSALEDSGWNAGALIRDADGRPTWRYRVEPFQAAIKASGERYEDIAVRCGMSGDWLTRMVGIRSYKHGKQAVWYRAKTVSYVNAVKLARALDLDFVKWEL